MASQLIRDAARDHLLTPKNSAMLIIDYQPVQVNSIASMDRQGNGPYPVVMNIHGGFWRNEYDLTHAGHLCAALTAKGVATWNLEYRRVGDEGGGWPGTFSDITNVYRFIAQLPKRYHLDTEKVVVMGHSASGQLALCLADHQASVKHAISLAGVVDLRRAWDLHLGTNALVEFLGDPPDQVPEHYHEADPTLLEVKAEQWLFHGLEDDVVPPPFSRDYCDQKKRKKENVHLVEIAKTGHFELIDPRPPPGLKSTRLCCACSPDATGPRPALGHLPQNQRGVLC